MIKTILIIIIVVIVALIIYNKQKNKPLYFLIGEKLGHSFSKTLHLCLLNDKYELKQIKKEDLSVFFTKKNFKGLNITIPYKQESMKYMDEIDDVAKTIGAINTVVNYKNKLYGYNTDINGFEMLLLINKINVAEKNVLILGDGATSKTIEYVIKKQKGKIYKVSRKQTPNTISYEAAKNIDANVIVNTTPCGMYPNIEDKIIDINNFKNLEAVVDVIYNPLRTRLLQDGEEKNIKTANGLYMLVAQGFYSELLFKCNDKKETNENDTSYMNIITKAYNQLLRDTQNIVFIGMPASGKTTIGERIANELKREFIDTDKEIEKKIGISIQKYIETKGEQDFRKIERNIIKEVSLKKNVVISTGGGVILDKNNIINLKANGKIYYLSRDVHLLPITSDRPLSNDKEKLMKMFEERKTKYEQYADVIINNNNAIDETINLIKKEFLK